MFTEQMPDIRHRKAAVAPLGLAGVELSMADANLPQLFTGVAHRVGHFIIGVRASRHARACPCPPSHPRRRDSSHKRTHSRQAHHFWNGCFFMYRTVDANTRFTIKEREARLKAA